jgi:hexosaminidase
MKKYFLSLCLLLSAKCFSQLNIVPMPAEVKMGKGVFTINKNTKIIASGLPEKFGTLLNDFIFSNYGLQLKTTTYSKKNVINSINFVHDGKLYGAGIGVYTIKITDNGILIGAGTPQGFFNGIQTLFQLLSVAKNNLSVSQLYISDYPRFKYRGMHLDVARHFMSVDFVKKYIDYLAVYKFNTFHWHLTDDQGWRIEIKKYPLLTSVGGYRNGTIIGRYPGKGNTNTPHGGFYTQQQIKDIVQYAAERYITIIPEIEMPGHATAAIAAYPELSCFPNEDVEIPKGCTWSGTTKGKQVQQTWGVFEDVFTPTENTFTFLQNVLDEVMQLFPSQYIHIGGDECPKEAWKRSTFCQQLIKDKNLKDEHGLQSYFIGRIEKYINSKGKNIIGWDEILEGGLAPNATVMSWRGEEGGIEAAKQNHDVVMTPGSHCYLDHSQSKNEDSITIGGYLPIETVYNYEPVPAVLNAAQATHILGAQGNVWTEYMNNSAKVEYMIFPRMIALSEVLWSPKDKKNWNDFEKRLPALLERLEKNGINYSKAFYDLKATVLPEENNEGVIWQLERQKNDKQSFHTTEFFEFDSLTTIYTFDKNGKKKGSTQLKHYIKSRDFTEEIVKVKITKYNSKVTANLFDARPPYPFEYLFHDKFPLITIAQTFSFNKATGKKITIVNPPSKSYPGDGAFTLVNGVQNEKGLAKSSEFVGFNGTDLDVTIDLGAITAIKKVTLHILEQSGSWIYAPSKVDVQYLMSLDTDPQPILRPSKITSVDVPQGNEINKVEVVGVQSCRYIRLIAKNYGVIPAGKPGAGNPAWLFADEIEVE